MNKISFIVPQKQHKEMVLDYKREHFLYNESTLYGTSMLDSKETYEEWLSIVGNKTKLPEGWVKSSTFLVMDDKRDKLIGMVDIRHELNAALRESGGHIGYGVRPSMRKKGFATLILKQALNFCESINIKEVMVACDQTNIASSKTILKCGGVLEKEVYIDDKIMKIFWIEV